MIEVGTLVRYLDDGEIGIVTKVYEPTPDGRQYYKIKWFDGAHGDHRSDGLEELI